MPGESGIAPGYARASLPGAAGQTRADLIAAREGGAVAIHAGAKLWRALLEPGGALEIAVAPGRHAWAQVARGAAIVAGQSLAAGDGLALADPGRVAPSSARGAELPLFDLA